MKLKLFSHNVQKVCSSIQHTCWWDEVNERCDIYKETQPYILHQFFLPHTSRWQMFSAFFLHIVVMLSPVKVRLSPAVGSSRYLVTVQMYYHWRLFISLSLIVISGHYLLTLQSCGAFSTTRQLKGDWDFSNFPCYSVLLSFVCCLLLLVYLVIVAKVIKNCYISWRLLHFILPLQDRISVVFQCKRGIK